ncbi:hypothetical protein [Streptomyces sp. NPDC004270]
MRPSGRCWPAVPAHELDAAVSLRRLARGTGRWAALAQRSGDPGHVGEWLAELRRGPLTQDAARWDVLTLVTTWIDCNEPGAAPILRTLPPDIWRTPAPGRPAGTREAEPCRA